MAGSLEGRTFLQLACRLPLGTCDRSPFPQNTLPRITIHGYITQWLDRLAADQQIPGSNPDVHLLAVCARASPTTSTREWHARLWRTVWAPSYRHAEFGPRKNDEARLVSTQTASSISFLSGRGASGWCSDVTSSHGAWRHAGIRFLLPCVSAPNLSYLPRSPAVPRTLARPSAKKA